MEKRIFLSPPDMCGEELRYVNKAFDANWIAPAGPDIDAFEKEICALTGASHAVALASGTAALHLSLIVNNAGPSDDIYCSSFTFAGSAFPITYTGAHPVFIDSESNSWNMDPELLEKAVTDSIANKRTPKAVIVVHLYGQCANLDAIQCVCKKYNLLLIEDAAESLGAICGNVQTGTIGDFGIYSFNGNKIITTSGGGMIVGHNRELLDKIRYLSTQAREPFPYYHHTTIGYNYRMSNVSAAIGRGQLTSLESKVEKRRSIYEYYQKSLNGYNGITVMPRDTFGKANCWLTCITIDKSSSLTPDIVRLALEKENIESRPLWKPMHLQPIFANCKSFTNGVSEDLFDRGLCLPSGSSLSSDDLERIVEVVRGLTPQPPLRKR
ncbi:MAG: aminotransferase class I/II-fold pyridoxal phosphate-dependent enzyme [Fibrobacter sp.]|nr:aminotransferase class I/II-fold pyridoxal phosphate-dependent enzyme [Fibrobacter sp.]